MLVVISNWEGFLKFLSELCDEFEDIDNEMEGKSVDPNCEGCAIKSACNRTECIYPTDY